MEVQPSNYEAIWVKSRFLVREGKSEEAEKIIKEAMEKSSETEIAGFGNMMLGLGITDRAIKIFLIYTERYPKSANAWYSLGEAYFKKGDKLNSIKSFKNALTLEPSENVRTNSEKFLQQLGAL